jgi:hypothetical protein
LPIIFQFKSGDVRNGDPQPSTLMGGTGEDRYASRLIFRPMICSKDQAAGLACILVGPKDPPSGYSLDTPSGEFPVTAELSPSEAKLIPALHGNPDVLQAFLDTL